MRVERSRVRRLASAAALCAVAAGGLAAAPSPWALSAEGRRALDAVSADSLRGHLSFLASDALGGRVTGTAGQEIAAEYLAAQFRRAALEPLGDDGYFQSAPAVVATPNAEGFRLAFAVPEATIEVRPEQFQMTTVEPVSVDGVEVVKLPQGQTPPPEVAGRA